MRLSFLVNTPYSFNFSKTKRPKSSSGASRSVAAFYVKRPYLYHIRAVLDLIALFPGEHFPSDAKQFPFKI
jgi:hypothetical protein